MKVTTGGTQKEAQTLELSPAKVTTLHYDLEYDFTKPESTLHDFVASVKAMISRFEYNKARIIAVEAELVDLYHYIEITPYKNVPDGYKLYRKMAELRRERRACKNENDLLQPIYEHFHATEVLNKLNLVQGECAKCKGAIDARTYTVRTNILDEYMNPPVKVEVIAESEEEEKDDLILGDLPVLQEESLELMDDPAILKSPGKTEKKPMSAFKQVWRAAN